MYELYRKCTSSMENAAVVLDNSNSFRNITGNCKTPVNTKALARR